MRISSARIFDQQLEQCRATASEVKAEPCKSDPCALQHLVACPELSDEMRTRLHRAIEAGFTLRSSLPHCDPSLMSDWLGERWYLVHRMHLFNVGQWSGIVGSRFDRRADDFSQWPVWIERAVRTIARDRQTLLMIHATTTTAIIQPLALRANLKCLTVQLPPSHKNRTTLGGWLTRAITELEAGQSVASATLWLSDASRPASKVLDQLPLRDRVLFALSHRLIALSIRDQGNIAELLLQRLQDERFPIATVSVRLPNGDLEADGRWLEHRAVGWYLPRSSFSVEARADPSDTNTGLGHPACGSLAHSNNTIQWTASAYLWKSQTEYLVHCVRGDDQAGFRNGRTEAVIDAIMQGQLKATSPFETLQKIANSSRVRASGKLLRTGAAAVSFTAVPLIELMKRRRYQPHLGRWDWEPYGFMIRRDVLEQLGARPVIYGDEALFDHLDPGDRPFFQPAQRRSARNEHEHWRAEDEWRLLDDVRLSELPVNSLILFVDTELQARALAARYPWPVIWQRADQTQQPPSSRARRRRICDQTSRS